MSADFFASQEAYETFIARFESAAFTLPEWTHAAHLAMGLWYVAHYPPLEAGVRIRTGIRCLNESMGGTNSETSGFHETLTEFWILIARDWLATHPFSLASANAFILHFSTRAACWKDCFDGNIAKDRYARRAWVRPRAMPAIP